MKIRHLAALCASAVLLAACGGDSDGTPPPLTCSVPVTLGGGSWMQNDGLDGSSVGA